ncbi:MAG: hypothetical protein H6898_15995 [Rhodobacter sp.]|nr:hypothetical protein [Paracoccaceae bacterium]MCC0078059.1 hypothetical protein [Rhodobacter sp.]
MAHYRRLTGAALIAALCLGTHSAQAQGFEVETGIDVFADPNTRIEGLHRLYVGHRVSPHFSFGQSIYSSALGDAGGAFFWGFEGVAHIPLSQRLSLGLSGFVGGGGGAAQVVGDGTMLRAGLSLDYRLSQAWDLQLTSSWIRIAGAPIDDPAFGLGLRYRFGGTDTAPGSTPEFDDLAAVAMQLLPASGVRARSGGRQGSVSLVGVRAQFDVNERTQLSFSAAGAARGAQGYMQIMGGARRTFAMNRLSFFVEGRAGFAGGGDVDTGAGMLVGASAGVSLQVSHRFDVELAFGGMTALDGDFRAGSVSLSLVRSFDRARAGGGGERWAFSTGLSAQTADASFYLNPVGRDDYVAMQETSLDYFVGRRIYLTGNAQTTVAGGVSGYALGLVGLGYEMPLGDRWSLSVEGLLGAAGGGGVNTAGGIVAGLRAEVDYRVGDAWRLSMGLGQLASVRSGGMSPTTVTLGVKIPFTTHR